MSMLGRLGKITRIILAAYLSIDNQTLDRTVTPFFNELRSRLKTRGALDMITFVKTNRNLAMRYILGNPIYSSETFADGWPKAIPYLQEFTKVEHLKALLTVLTVTRAFNVDTLPDTSTITEPWSGSDVIQNSEITRAMRCLAIRRGGVPEFKFPHITTKKGPLGQALMSAMTELTLLEPLQLKDDIILLGGSNLSDLINSNTEPLDILEAIKPKEEQGWFTLSKWWKREFPTTKKTLRRLSYFPDKEGKVRVIAILDYWSQCCLKPLHNKINSYLRRVPTDMTFNQGAFTAKLPADLGKHSFHSIDLTAATDRMPIALQKRVVEYLYDCSVKADAWERVLVQLPYKLKLKRIKDPVDLVYTTGQPMGAYSSWPVMALTHHLIVQVASFRAGIGGFNPKTAFKGYALLGDDLRIDHDLVAKEYKILIKELGMPYSEAKTHTSKDGFEFAKRWFFRGSEITGFSTSGLMSVWKSYPQLINFLDNQSSHGWELPFEGHPDLILQLHKAIHGEKFIFNKFQSMMKLYQLFYWLRHKKSHAVYSSHIREYLCRIIGDTNWPILFNLQDQDIINLMYLRARRNLVEKDLSSFQTQAYKVNAKLWGFVKRKIKEAGVDHSTEAFLMETLSVVLNYHNPVVLCINRLIDQSTEFLMNYWDPDVSDDFLYSEGLSKYSLSKGVFSMRSSVSIMLAESAILKEFISVARAMNNHESDDYKAIAERITSLKDGDTTRM
jgi:hypothetical protein